MTEPPVDYSREGLLKLRQRVGIVFPGSGQPAVFPPVYTRRSPSGVLNLGKSEAEARQEVERVIEKMGISPFRDRP